MTFDFTNIIKLITKIIVIADIIAIEKSSISALPFKNPASLSRPKTSQKAEAIEKEKRFSQIVINNGKTVEIKAIIEMIPKVDLRESIPAAIVRVASLNAFPTSGIKLPDAIFTVLIINESFDWASVF